MVREHAWNVHAAISLIIPVTERRGAASVVRLPKTGRRRHDARGVGEYLDLTPRVAWATYGLAMGARSFRELCARFRMAPEQPVGHIVLDDFRLAENRVQLGLFVRETGVNLADSVQVGKIIDDQAADWLEYAMFGGEEASARAIGPLVDRAVGSEEPGRREVVRELIQRDPAVVEHAKRKQGTRCRVWGFDFGEFYGELGDGFIEVHHWPMLSVGGPDTTRNVVVVCANCHRMLQRRREGMDWEELWHKVRARH